MIDRIQFNEFFSGFDTDIIIEVIEIYLTEYEKEFQNVAYSACKLRGMISTFCDPVATEQSIRLESISRNNIEDGLEMLLDELEISNGLMVKELKEIKIELIKNQN